jgi:pyridoxal phosphate phosphatase PHOSPHO2
MASAAANVVVVFDFDRTIIEWDSDDWVITKLGATDAFQRLRPTMSWNPLMVRTAPPHPNTSHPGE